NRYRRTPMSCHLDSLSGADWPTTSLNRRGSLSCIDATTCYRCRLILSFRLLRSAVSGHLVLIALGSLELAFGTTASGRSHTVLHLESGVFQSTRNLHRVKLP